MGLSNPSYASRHKFVSVIYFILLNLFNFTSQILKSFQELDQVLCQKQMMDSEEVVTLPIFIHFIVL